MTNRQRRLVVKDNALINACYNLSLAEQRLVLLAIVEARSNNQGVSAADVLSVHADSYMTQFGVTKQTAYEALKDASAQLFKREFSYQELHKKGIFHIQSRWVSQVSYLDSTASVQLVFAPAVIPMITALEKHFTSYELDQVSNLTSAYAIRLYETLIAWRATGKTPIISIEEFRLKLGVELHEYQQMNNFKNRVLDPALNQINAHTDIFVKYEQHKTGRKITGFSFTFKPKNAPKPVKKQGREQISRDEAAQKARPGEDWNQLVKRLSKQYKITDL